MSISKKCTKCSNDFKIIDQEENFYKEKDYPLPERCPKCRREDRVSERHERELYGYNCDKCNKDIVVAFDPSDDDLTVYCKKCYQEFTEQNDCIVGYSEGAKQEGQAVPGE